MTTHKVVPEGYETRVAVMEASRNHAADQYFTARPQIDSLDRRRVYESAYARAWDDAQQHYAAAPAPSGEAVYRLEIARTMAHLHDANGYTGGSFHYKSPLDKERAHAIVDRLNAHPPAERAALQSATDNREVTLLRAVYEAARRFIRNNGVDRERASAAVDELDDAIERVKNFDGGYDEVDTVWDTSATVEAATNHDRGYLTGLLAGWNLCMEGDVSGFDSAVKTTRALIADARAEQSEYCKACSDAGVCYVCGKTSQPAQQAHDWSDAPQGATHYQPHQRAYYKRISATEWYVWSRINNGEPRRWLYSAGTGDSGEWIVRSVTTPQAEAQAGETAEEYKPLTDDECDEFRRLPGSFNDMMRAVHEDGWTRYCGVANEFIGNYYKRKFERAQLAAQDRLDEAAKWIDEALNFDANIADATDEELRVAMTHGHASSEIQEAADMVLRGRILLRALRNGKEEG